MRPWVRRRRSVLVRGDAAGSSASLENLRRDQKLFSPARGILSASSVLLFPVLLCQYCCMWIERVSFLPKSCLCGVCCFMFKLSLRDIGCCALSNQWEAFKGQLAHGSLRQSARVEEERRIQEVKPASQTCVSLSCEDRHANVAVCRRRRHMASLAVCVFWRAA